MSITSRICGHACEASEFALCPFSGWPPPLRSFLTHLMAPKNSCHGDHARQVLVGRACSQNLSTILSNLSPSPFFFFLQEKNQINNSRSTTTPLHWKVFCKNEELKLPHASFFFNMLQKERWVGHFCCCHCELYSQQWLTAHLFCLLLSFFFWYTYLRVLHHSAWVATLLSHFSWLSCYPSIAATFNSLHCTLKWWKPLNYLKNLLVCSFFQFPFFLFSCLNLTSSKQNTAMVRWEIYFLKLITDNPTADQLQFVPYLCLNIYAKTKKYMYSLPPQLKKMLLLIFKYGI